jgi:hypothetical protein
VHVLAGATPMQSSDGQTYMTYPNLEAFSGQAPALERGGHQVVVGTHNRHPFLGELALLHCHRMVYPLTFGGADDTDDWSLGDWCDQCHRKNGLVVWTNFGSSLAPEALAHALLGHIDAVEILSAWKESISAWYLLLRAGVRMPLVGASGKCGNAWALGAMRTYAKLKPDEAMGSGAWVNAVQAGRTIISSGQFLEFEVDGEYPGATLVRSAGSEVVVAAGARCEIVWNGRVVGRGRCQFAVATSGWIAARDTDQQFVHSSPIWMDVEGSPQPRDEAAVNVLRRRLELGKEWIEREGRFEKARSREALMEVFAEAMATVE